MFPLISWSTLDDFVATVTKNESMMLAKDTIPCDFASYLHASDVNVATTRDEHVTTTKKKGHKIDNDC